METKLTIEHLNGMKQNWEYNQGLMVSCDGLRGGLALLWNPLHRYKFKIFQDGLLMLIYFVMLGVPNGGSLVFYGQLDTSRREETWALLESLKRSNNLPWLYLNDYNEIISQTEKSSGGLQPTKQKDRFRSVIHHCGFTELGYTRSPYTWYRDYPI